MKHNHRSMRPHAESGIALLEALIAILLFSLGILALVGLQAVMSKNITDAKLRGEAAFLANQLIGQMWADQANLSKYAIADPGDECSDDAYTKCSEWLGTVQHQLPNGKANVTINSTNVNIRLSWQLPNEAAAGFQIDAQVTR